ELFAKLLDGHVLSPDGLDRGAQEVGHRYARNGDRVLESKVYAQLRPRIRRQRCQILSLVQDFPASHGVSGVTHQRVGESRLAGAVAAHKRVDLARVYAEANAFEDLFILDPDVQVFDRQ